MVDRAAKLAGPRKKSVAPVAAEAEPLDSYSTPESSPLSSFAVRESQPVSTSREPGSIGRTYHRDHAVKATVAQNQFGKILRDARDSGPVFIERHGKPQAVVMDIADYEAIVRKAQPPEEKKLESLRGEFDAMYARMQTKTSRSGVDWLLKAPAEDLNKAARRNRVKPRG